MITVFWICVTLVAYTYAIYPITIALLARVRGSRKAPPANNLDRPRVSVVLCARNEAGRISRRLENICRQEYDSGKLEVVVVSDGSTDGTAEAIMAFRSQRSRQVHAGPKITLIDKKQPEGKAAGLNDAVAASSGEVLVMTDARQEFGRDDSDVSTIRRLVDMLSHPDIGCVSGELVFIGEDGGSLQSDLGAYWCYEKWIRRSESAIGSVPGVTGAIYAMKRQLFEPLPRETILDDVVIPLRVVLRGHRVVFDGRSFARDHPSSHATQEWRRKVRTLAGNWQLVNLVPAAFHPLRNRIWVQFISHKILRLLVPFALVLILLTSALTPHPAYRAFLTAQLLLYGCALLGACNPGWRNARIIGTSHTFVLLNLAAVAGFWAWATGRSSQTWARTSEHRA